MPAEKSSSFAERLEQSPGNGDRPPGLRLLAYVRVRSTSDTRRVVYGNVRKSIAMTVVDRKT